jgi:NADH-quinone oxidoreductase subunit L
MYKCGLFLTGGAVEKSTGTTNLENLGGLRAKMPVTFICFFITAASISGVPPFNGFFSKELVYDAAMQRGWIFYLAAILGSFFTAASFLKLGHAAYFGKSRKENKDAKEVSVFMLIPMITLAAVCVIFGVFNYLPINNFIKPILGARAEGHNFTGSSVNMTLGIITVLVLLGAIIHHLMAAKIMGGGIKAAEHIHHAPVLSVVYRWAEKKYLDPYEVGVKFVKIISKLLWRIDRGIDWIYESLTPSAALFVSRTIRRMHTGYYAVYIAWSLVGALLIMLFIFR